MVWPGSSSTAVVNGAAALTILALFLGLYCRRDLLIPPCVGRGCCQWRARSSRQPFARFGILNLAKNATRAYKIGPNGKRAPRRIAKLLALDLLAWEQSLGGVRPSPIIANSSLASCRTVGCFREIAAMNTF
jgi:hypothetical protein